MKLCSLPSVERARPLLGCVVRIRVHGFEEPAALRCIDRAFAEIADVHRRMSFHQPESELSFVNGNAHLRPVFISETLRDVMACAHGLALATDGLFDITVAPEVVTAGKLPRHFEGALPEGDWRDIELRSDGTVFFSRSLWMDLGGIAKGYAVDRAVASLREAGVPSAIVNAGGDIGVLGDIAEQIWLRVDGEEIGDAVPVVEISDGSLASSSTALHPGTHFHGRNRTALSDIGFATVAAPQCMVADALTKVALAGALECQDLFHRFGAQAFVHRPSVGWSALQ